MVPSISRVHVPVLDWQLEISTRDKKVLAVAIASLLFFGIQVGLSLPITFAITFLIGGLTYICENNRTKTEDWFNTDFNKEQLGIIAAILILKPFILQIVFWALGIPLPVMPQVELAQAILSQPWKMLPIAAIFAPFAEEVLFRGFLLERLEDMTSLVNRHVVSLSREAQEYLSNAAQAIIFGLIHLRRTIEKGMHIPVLITLSFAGYLFALFKREDNTLLVPSAIHSANNIGAVIYIFQSRK